MTPLLEVSDLCVRFGDQVDALRGVSFRLDAGESLAVVGETGSGKSTLALCLAGLIQPPEARGSVRVAGQELMGATSEVLRSTRWAKVAVGIQGSPFNPVVSVGDQVAEPLREHRRVRAAEARRRADELAAEVLLDPALLERFPHQLSGGERRRAMLAMVLALDPDLVVLDEPTAGLDPVTKNQLISRIRALAKSRGLALIVISHDLTDAARLAEGSMVLYAGQVMELGSTSRVLGEPAHPYSWALMNAYPLLTTTKDLRPIRGRPPDPRAVPSGCPFHPRCTQVEEVCWQRHPGLVSARGREVACHFGGLKTLLSAVEVHKTFRTGGRDVPALRGVSLVLREGESLGIVGPSGSGKSTLAGIIAGHKVTDRIVVLDGGQVVEEGPSNVVSLMPQHATTRGLLEAASTLAPIG